MNGRSRPWMMRWRREERERRLGRLRSSLVCERVCVMTSTFYRMLSPSARSAPCPACSPRARRAAPAYPHREDVCACGAAVD